MAGARTPHWGVRRQRVYAVGAGGLGTLGAFGAPGTPGTGGGVGAPGGVGIPGIGAALAPQLGQASAFGSTSAPHLGHFTGPLSTVGGLKHMVRPLCVQGRVVVVRRLPDAPCNCLLYTS